MTRLLRMLAAAAMAAGAACPVAGASAADLTGGWATEGSACDALFVKSGNQISFRNNSELFGGGVIIDGAHIRGKAQSCTIKARRDVGDVTHLLAGCASDIMLSNVQFSVKLVDPDTFVRIFPGMEGMEMTYKRCKL